jgi:hypothetical protein
MNKSKKREEETLEKTTDDSVTKKRNSQIIKVTNSKDESEGNIQCIRSFNK